MHFHSEYNTKPFSLLLCHPKHSFQHPSTLENFDLHAHNFDHVPDLSSLFSEYDDFITLLKNNGIKTIDIFDQVSEEHRQSIQRNPNAMFTRDSSITLPWAPDLVILSKFSLQTRHSETAVLKSFFDRQTSYRILTCPYHLEGGDVIPVTIAGIRTILVGIGARTELNAAKWLAEILVPESADQVLAVYHDERFLHLDTSLAFLPNKTVLGARTAQIMLGRIEDGTHYKTHDTLADFLERAGFTWIETGSMAAIKKELCNLLPIGNNVFIGFNLDDQTRLEAENISGAEIVSLLSTALIQANGGAHCLSRPMYE